MHDSIFLGLKNNQLIETLGADFFRGKRMLFCTVNNPHQRVTQVYCKYLARLKKKIFKYGIEQIHTINFFDIWSIAIVNDIFPSLTPLVNKDLKFISHIKNLYNLESRWPLEFLAEFWEFQILINNGEIEFFSQSSTENIEYKIASACKENINKAGDLDKNSKLYYFGSILHKAKSTPSLILRQAEFYDNIIISRSIRYNSLWPATALLHHLEKNN